MTDLRRIYGAANVPEGGVERVDIEEHEIAVANVGGELFAFDNICRCVAHFAGHIERDGIDRHTHGGRLARLQFGKLDGEKITCPEHETVYSIRNGRPLSGPGEASVSTYEVHAAGDDLLVAVMSDSERHFRNDPGHKDRPR